MKKNIILSFVLLFQFNFSIFSQETSEYEANLNKTPYELFVLSATEMLKVYNSYDEATLAALAEIDKSSLICQKKCLEINIELSKKYHLLDPTYTLQEIQKGKTSTHSEAWTEEMSKCTCE